jgi:Cytochrome c554 and c-prime
MKLRRAFSRAAAFAALIAVALPLSARAQQAGGDGIHLGVASCAGDNCHGAASRPAGARVPQNEYLVWKTRDKHAKAYAVLSNDVGKRIAANLGLKNGAENDPMCLSCHADYVAPNQRGPRYQLADGVGCEGCHGGASGWLGTHISGASHAANVAAGLYQTDDAQARADRCLSCHIGDGTKVGDAKRAISHTIMGAGHPPMPFELDTYTAIQPAHYVVDQGYTARGKKAPNDLQVWAVGQAIDLKKRMAEVLDPANAPKGANPELVLFDCQACHHAMNRLQWRPRQATGLGPGKLRLYDASAVMAAAAATRAAPQAAGPLNEHLKALHTATAEGGGDYWASVKRQAELVQQDADKIAAAAVAHNFNRDDAKALVQAIIAQGGQDLDYSAARQEVMALSSIVAGMKALGLASEAQAKTLNDALGPVFDAVTDDQSYSPDTFLQALRQFQAKLPP